MPVWLAVPVFTLDLSTSDGGLSDGGDTGQWAWADPAAGPVGGGACWGTNPDGDYLHDTVDWLDVALPDLSVLARPTLVIRHWYAIRAGDAGTLEVDGGAGFASTAPAGGYPDPAGFVGTTATYVEDTVDLRGLGPSPVVRLLLTADASEADAGWYVQTLTVWDGDVLPPVITPQLSPADTQDLDGPYTVSVDVVEDTGPPAVTLWWSAAGAPAAAIPMARAAQTFTAGIPAVPPDTVVSWWVEADDGENLGRWPATGEEQFRVFLAAPTGLAGPEGPHVVADRVTLTWQAPDSPHAVLGYRVIEEGSPVVVLATGTSASVPLSPHTSQRFAVEAEYAAAFGDASDVLALDVEVPELLSVEPPVGYAGETLWLELAGSSLYVADGATTLDLGADVDVEAIEVRDVTRLVARVAISPAARPGPVAVTLGGAQGTFTFDAAFEIRDDDDAPRIASIEPAALRQGDEVRITLEATVPFADVPVVSTDADLVVLSAVTLAGSEASFRLAASTRARLGVHTLEVDDGVRPYTVDLQVDEYVTPVQRGCATGRGTHGPWLIAALALASRRRRP